jgi:hypothetical protein
LIKDRDALVTFYDFPAEPIHRLGRNHIYFTTRNRLQQGISSLRSLAPDMSASSKTRTTVQP